MVAVTFNLLDGAGAPNGHHACVQLNLAATVGHLKERIGLVLGLPPDEFRIYRKTGALMPL